MWELKLTKLLDLKQKKQKQTVYDECTISDTDISAADPIWQGYNKKDRELK